MSQSVTLNSASFSIPDVGDEDWGQDVTDYLVAIPGAVLQKSGGAFTLTAEIDFGASFGLKSIYYKSRTANPADAGQVRLARADVVSWRNQANGANLDLGVNASDVLLFNSVALVTVAGATMTGNLAFANQTGIRFMELTVNGTNYVQLVAPDAVTSNVTLKLPDGVGTAGQILSTDGTGVLSWIAASGGGVINTGVQGRLAIYASAGTTLDDVVTMTNTVSIAIAAHGQGSVYTIPDSGSATADFVMTAGTQSIAGAKTFSGAIVFSVSSTAAFRVSQSNTLQIDSTNGLVSIGTTTMTYPLYVSKSLLNSTMSVVFENSSSGGTSNANLLLVTGGASGGDPYLTFYNGLTHWSIGEDNSDGDVLVITNASTLNGTNIVRIDAAALAITVATSISAAVTITPTTNQIVLGTTRTVTITAPTPASSSRTWTIPDITSDGTFVALEGTQTLTGAKTFQNNALAQIISSSGTDVNFTVSNTSNTSSAFAGVRVLVAGSTADDPYVVFTITGQTSWVIGIDNSASDVFRICNSSSLGTTNYMTLGASAVISNNDFYSQRSQVGGIVYNAVDNSDTGNGASHAVLFARSGGASGGDPFINWNVSGVTNWVMGIDNSDSDALVISEQATLGGNNRLRIATGGVFTMSGTVTISGVVTAQSDLSVGGNFTVTGASQLTGNIFFKSNSFSQILSLDQTEFIQIRDSGISITTADGILIGAATGGAKGASTINIAADIYKNNTAYANPDYALEHWANGKVEKFIGNDGAATYPGIMPIEKLEAYMRANYDLPGVKERFRDVDGGQGIFARGDIALEKIEESFIYIVSLHNRQDSLERRVEALEAAAA